jgi:hypothetical protein
MGQLFCSAMLLSLLLWVDWRVPHSGRNMHKMHLSLT